MYIPLHPHYIPTTSPWNPLCWWLNQHQLPWTSHISHWIHWIPNFIVGSLDVGRPTPEFAEFASRRSSVDFAAPKKRGPIWENVHTVLTINGHYRDERCFMLFLVICCIAKHGALSFMIYSLKMAVFHSKLFVYHRSLGNDLDFKGQTTSRCSSSELSRYVSYMYVYVCVFKYMYINICI